MEMTAKYNWQTSRDAFNVLTELFFMEEYPFSTNPRYKNKVSLTELSKSMGASKQTISDQLACFKEENIVVGEYNKGQKYFTINMPVLLHHLGARFDSEQKWETMPQKVRKYMTATLVLSQCFAEWKYLCIAEGTLKEVKKGITLKLNTLKAKHAILKKLEK
ncbi:MAG: winged helix-turn-helix domain-containing protein [Candidatus Diapherotrites archaeon]